MPKTGRKVSFSKRTSLSTLGTSYHAKLSIPFFQNSFLNHCVRAEKLRKQQGTASGKTAANLVEQGTAEQAKFIETGLLSSKPLEDEEAPDLLSEQTNSDAITVSSGDDEPLIKRNYSLTSSISDNSESSTFLSASPSSAEPKKYPRIPIISPKSDDGNVLYFQTNFSHSSFPSPGNKPQGNKTRIAVPSVFPPPSKKNSNLSNYLSEPKLQNFDSVPIFSFLEEDSATKPNPARKGPTNSNSNFANLTRSPADV